MNKKDFRPELVKQWKGMSNEKMRELLMRKLRAQFFVKEKTKEQ